MGIKPSFQALKRDQFKNGLDGPVRTDDLGIPNAACYLCTTPRQSTAGLIRTGNRRFRRPELCPLSYGSKTKTPIRAGMGGYRGKPLFMSEPGQPQ